MQEEIPQLIADSQAQPLTATSTLTATLPGSAAQRAVRPVTAVYTYNDVSPVVSADAVRDADLDVTIVKVRVRRWCMGGVGEGGREREETWPTGVRHGLFRLGRGVVRHREAGLMMGAGEGKCQGC